MWHQPATINGSAKPISCRATDSSYLLITTNMRSSWGSQKSIAIGYFVQRSYFSSFMLTTCWRSNCQNNFPLRIDHLSFWRNSMACLWIKTFEISSFVNSITRIYFSNSVNRLQLFNCLGHLFIVRSRPINCWACPISWAIGIAQLINRRINF